MRILYSHYLADDDHPDAQMIRAIARELRARGHELFVHRSAGPPEQAEPTARSSLRGTRRLRKAFWFTSAMTRNRAMFRRDVEVIEAVKPTIILTRQDAYCISMVEAARRFGVPLVTYATTPVAHEARRYGRAEGRFHPPGLIEAVERRTLRHSRAVITISGPAARLLGRYELPTPVHVVPNGVAPERFPLLDPTEHGTLRAQSGLTAPFVIGFVGTFKPYHAIDKLRDLILNTAHRQDIQWLLIGDGPERARLEASLSGRNGVTFLGRRPAEEMGRWMAIMDIAVAPHPQPDGEFYFCPLTILEYAAAGCCVIASNQGDIPRLLDYGRAGITFADSSCEAWVRSILKLIDDKAWRQKLGASARTQVMTHYTWRNSAEQVESILISALTSTPLQFDLRPRRGNDDIPDHRDVETNDESLSHGSSS